MNTKMRFRHKFAYSFFDFSAYKEFLKQGLWRSILYIFLVTLIFSTIINISQITSINSEISNLEDTLIHNAPNFQLQDSSLSVDSNEILYYKHDGDFLFNFMLSSALWYDLINNPDQDSSTISSSDEDDTNYYIFIIDSKNKADSSILSKYKDGVYINSNSAVIRKGYATISQINFASLPGLNLDNSALIHCLDSFKFLFAIFLLTLQPIVLFIRNLLIGFIFIGPVSSFIGSLMGVKLTYSESATLSFYAMTLPLFLQILLDVAGIVLPMDNVLIYFSILTLIYCGLAINKIKNTDKTNFNYM